MNLSNILTHPSWAGIGAIAGIVGVLVAIIALWLSSSTSKNIIQQPNTIEFFDLLNMFSVTPERQGTIGALNWDTGASETSPIKWKHSGLKFMDNLSPEEQIRLPQSFGSTFREGKVIITNKGKASHSVLKESLKPVKWTVRMFGVRSGADVVTLSNSTMAFPYEEDGTGELIVDKKYAVESMKLCRSNEMLTSITDIRINKVKIPKKRPFWIVINSYCGGVQTQCSYEYTLFLQKPYKDQIHEIIKSCLDELP